MRVVTSFRLWYHRHASGQSRQSMVAAEPYSDTATRQSGHREAQSDLEELCVL